MKRNFVLFVILFVFGFVAKSQNIGTYINARDTVGSTSTPTIGNESRFLVIGEGLPTNANSRAMTLWRLQQLVNVGGGIGGSISDNQIAVGSSTADEIEGSTSLTFDGATLSTDNVTASTTNGDLTLSGNGAGGVSVDNLRLDGNTLSSTNTDGDVIISPDGGGNTNLSTGGLEVQGTSVIGSSRSGTFTSLDVDNININTNTLSSTSGDITITPTGNVNISSDLSVVGALSKGSGTFKITHPLDTNKWLYHSFVEAPRADNIYRGKVQLENGIATVDIDTPSNMTIGTFEALNQNIQVFVANNDTWDLVKGTYSKGQIIIESNNHLSSAIIDWLVIGERKDQTVIDWDLTDKEGRLIPEHSKNN
tara:strand:+ start:11835 stop:12929 length:1095 start_codon:yes stop_codon:yes gene_type:complete